MTTLKSCMLTPLNKSCISKDDMQHDACIYIFEKQKKKRLTHYALV